MKLNFNHSILYTNQGMIPVQDVANSLIANEVLIRQAALVLERCVKGISIERVDVYFREATHSSPLREILELAFLPRFKRIWKKKCRI